MKRVEVMFEPAVVADLDKIASEAGTDRSFLIRKAVSLYLTHRKPKAPDETGTSFRIDRAWFPDDE